MEWYYDKNGIAVFFKYDDRLIGKDGNNLCWVSGGYIYSLKTGRHIGWFEGDKVYDIENGILAFSIDAKGLPYKPGIEGTPGTPGIPAKPGIPGFGGVFGRLGYFGFSKYKVSDYFLREE